MSIILTIPTIIQTPRLYMRPAKTGEGAMLHEAIRESFQELTKWMAWAKEMPSLEQQELYVRKIQQNWLLKDSDLPLLLFERKSERFLGGTGFNEIKWDVPCCAIGYWLRTDTTGFGYATEAANTLTRYAFEVLSMARVEIRCDAKNIKSYAVAQRLGFGQEGVLKKAMRRNDGSLADLIMYAKYACDDLPELSVVWE